SPFRRTWPASPASPCRAASPTASRSAFRSSAGPSTRQPSFASPMPTSARSRGPGCGLRSDETSA
ncbi:MAG: Aspartyl-tRNA(Asn) amidotransferase subunit A @ Glutamyl-tRNA(Gln) amidotransferase subunit A, partial [uncultured Thermomicrobiales bacterium]